jgi:hypothetical protein
MFLMAVEGVLHYFKPLFWTICPVQNKRTGQKGEAFPE